MPPSSNTGITFRIAKNHPLDLQKTQKTFTGNATNADHHEEPCSGVLVNPINVALKTKYLVGSGYRRISGGADKR
jgi:hypothetical protein